MMNLLNTLLNGLPYVFSLYMIIDSVFDIITEKELDELKKRVEKLESER
jgi:hypothetical protein